MRTISSSFIITFTTCLLDMTTFVIDYTIQTRSKTFTNPYTHTLSSIKPTLVIDISKSTTLLYWTSFTLDMCPNVVFKQVQIRRIRRPEILRSEMYVCLQSLFDDFIGVGRCSIFMKDVISLLGDTW